MQNKKIENKINKNTSKKNNFFKKGIYLKIYILGVCFSFLFAPFFANAAATYSQDLFGIFQYAKAIINDLVLWTFTTGAVLCFLAYLAYELFQMSQGKINDFKQTRQYILYGLIALTLMFTFYAVSGLIAVTFGIQLGIPQFFGSGNQGGSGNVMQSYSVLR